MNLAQQIIDGKTPTHAQLGVSLSTVNAQNAKRYARLRRRRRLAAGGWAKQKLPAAAEAGLQEGDIVTKFDGKDVASASDLMLDVRSKNPGDKVTLDELQRRDRKSRSRSAPMKAPRARRPSRTARRSLCSSACSAAAPAAPSRTLPSLRDMHHPP